MRRFRWTHLLQMVFGTVGGAFMVFVTLLLWRGDGNVDLLAWPVVLGFNAVMLAIVYGGLAGICNTLHIEIDRWQLRLWQSPLPHWSQFSNAKEEIRYLRRLTVRRQSSSNSSSSRRAYYTERLVLVDIRNRHHTILDDPSRSRVDELTEALSRHLECPLVEAGQDLPPNLGSSKKHLTAMSPTESPADVKLRHTQRGQELGVRWFQPIQIAVLIGCGFMALPVGFAWLMTLAFINQSPIMPLFLLVPLVFTVIVAGSAYAQIAGFFNSSWLFVSDGALHLEHRPLPWPGRITIPVAEVSMVAPRYESLADSQNASSNRCYSLVCKRTDGSEVSLYRRLTAEAAQFLATALNQQLACS